MVILYSKQMFVYLYFPIDIETILCLPKVSYAVVVY